MTPKRRPRFMLGTAGQAGPGVIAVTGAAGPAGRALVRSLLSRMDETARAPGAAAPVRVIAVDTAERIERLTAPPVTKGPAESRPPDDVRDQAPDPEAQVPEPGLEYAAETGPLPVADEASADTTTSPDASSAEDTPENNTPDHNPDHPRPRRRSYLPAGLTSTLTSARREPKEAKEAKEPKEPKDEEPGSGDRVPEEKAEKKSRPKGRKKPEEPALARPELGIVPGTDTGVDWRAADISSPDVVGVLDSADVVIHLATADDLAQAVSGSPSDRRLRAVRAAQAVSMAAAAVGARRFVAVTSAMVLGARPENPVPLADDASCRADLDDGLVGDLLEVERVLERIPRVHPGLEFTLIRPAALVGPGVDTAVTRHFEAPRLLVLRGTGTRWQFCHVDDLAEAIWTAVTGGISGPLSVGAAGSLDEAQVETISGMRRLEVPAGLAFSTAERLHRVGVLNTPAGELAYVVHPWVIGSTGLLAAGWQPRHDNETCLKGLLDDQRRRRAAPGWRVDRRDAAAMGAAGAAVALLGTAAIVRQARSRQSKRRRSTLDP